MNSKKKIVAKRQELVLRENNYIKLESNGDRKKNLSLTECLNEIKPYLRDIRITLQKSDTWKVELTNTINFISSKYVEEERVMHSKGTNIEFVFYDNANEVVDELFESLLLRYHIGLETSMRGRDFIFN